MIKEVHSGECGEHQGKKKLYRCLLYMVYYWPTMKKDTVEFVKKCRNCQVQANLIHTYPQNLHNMVTPCPSTLGGLIWWDQLTHHHVDTYGSWWMSVMEIP